MAHKPSKRARWNAVLRANEGEGFYLWQCGGDHQETIILNARVSSALCPDGHIYRKREEVSLEDALSYDHDLIFRRAQ